MCAPLSLLLLATGCFALVACSEQTDNSRSLILLELRHLPRELHKRQVPETNPEYLSLLQQYHSQLHSDGKHLQRPRSAQQAPRYQEQAYQPSQAYSLHQARLQASLAGENPNVQSFGSSDSSLQHQAALNAQQAAANFRQSYRKNNHVRTLQPTYAAETEQPQQYLVETSTPQPPQRAAPQHAVPQHAVPQHAVPQHAVPQHAVPQHAAPQANIRDLYQAYTTTTQLDPASQTTYQAYQQQASLAEQAALAFQQAIQQSPKSGQRPRLSTPQYVLEQQHSYVVPDTQDTATEVPEYNIAAAQQAYQQIETAQQQAVEEIQQPRQPAVRQRSRRPTPAPVTYEEDSGLNIGQGASFEFAKQSPRQPQTIFQETVVPSTRAPSRRQRVKQQQVQYVSTEAPAAPEVQYTRVQAAPEYVQAPRPAAPQYVRTPVAAQPEYTQVVQEPRPQAPQYARVPVTAAPQYVRTPVTQAPQYARAPVTAAPEYAQNAEAPRSPTPQYVQAPEPTQPAPRQYAATPEVPRSAAPQYVRSRVAATPEYTRTAPAAPQYSAPVSEAPEYSSEVAVAPKATQYSNEAKAAQAALPTKVGNIDINLLRSLYAAAESLANKHSDEVNPISEDDLIKALLEQGRREQQAASIIQNAAKNAPPAPTDKEIDVVRIPKPKSQRPITQDELHALIEAGYDVKPVGEPKLVGNATPDPIRQQYLRQAEFLEKQALYRNLKQRGIQQQSRPTRQEPQTE